jgi:hypothetical protein
MEGYMDTNIYLACYRQLFAVRIRTKQYSYRLDPETAEFLAGYFTEKGIPYRTEMDLFEDLPGDEIDILGPCNSRVVFEIDGKEFHILSFECYLIKNYFAEKISKSFLAKGISSRVELVGSHSNVRTAAQINYIHRWSALEKERRRPVKEAETKQLPLFDLDQHAPLKRRRIV